MKWSDSRIYIAYVGVSLSFGSKCFVVNVTLAGWADFEEAAILTFRVFPTNLLTMTHNQGMVFTVQPRINRQMAAEHALAF